MSLSLLVIVVAMRVDGNEKKFKYGQIRYQSEWKSIDRNLGERRDSNLILNLIGFQLLDKISFGSVSIQLGEVYNLTLSYQMAL